MKKNVLNFTIIIWGILLFVPQLAHAFSGGSGTSGSPWQIANATDLAEVANYNGTSSSGKFFILTSDIDLNTSPYNTGFGWTVIGNVSLRFQGTLDGNGHVISNLFISTSTQYVGLFGYVQNATIKNLGITNANVTSSHASASAGIMVGIGTVTSTNNYSTGVVSSTYSAGGLMGTFSGGTVSSSYSTAIVYGNGLGVGGLFGNVSAGRIYDSYATGNVTGYQRLGGFAGSISGSAVVSSSYATGNTNGNNGVGGFVGHIYQAYVYSSYATGNVTSSGSWNGGFFGFSQGGALSSGTHVSSSYATGNVYGTSACGGFGGYNEYLYIQDSYATGNVTCANSSGGFLGSVWGTNLARVYSVGFVTNTGATIGGLLGTNPGGGVTTSSVYWDTQTSGKSSSAGGATGKTTIQMKDQATFVGWDFAAIWNIDGSTNNGYPYLRSQSVADITSPSLNSFFPVDNATTTSSTVNLVLNFSEAVIPSTTGSITIYNNDGSVFESIVASSSQVTGSGSATIIINPSSALASEASYYVLVSSTAFSDSSGNAYVGISSATYWNFTVADETNPTVSSVFPSDNALDVTTTADLVINFSEAVTAQAGAITIYKTEDNSIFETINVTSSQITGTSTAQIVINPSSTFAYGASYYVFIAATAFDDINGNSYAGVSNSGVWNFTIMSDPSVINQDQAAVTPGTAIVAVAPAVGNANTEKTIGMYESSVVGNVSFSGINLLAYIGSQAMFNVLVSKTNDMQDHELRIDNLDTLHKKVLFTVSSEPQQFELDLGSSSEIDLDGDGIKDIKAVFADIWINRVEITVSSLLDREKSVSGENIDNVCSILFTRDLKIGMSGEDVRQLQKYLNKNGFIVSQSGHGSIGNESDYFGVKTKQAVMQMQKTQKVNTASYGNFDGTVRKHIGCTVQSDKSTFVFARNLKQGMRGEDVKQLQVLLNNKGFVVEELGYGSKGQETIYFGSGTKKALINFQKYYNILPADGYFGSLTKKIVSKNR
ncbi:MAG: Ig-like domain-containing protein [Candidatus Magasanikbacteria bacterium]|nr:Ig-like domain-containing protein [Candidatus Magasanikbacteria bacterium]